MFLEIIVCMLNQCWYGPVVHAPRECRLMYDMNYDNHVDLWDFAYFQTQTPGYLDTPDCQACPASRVTPKNTACPPLKGAPGGTTTPEPRDTPSVKWYPTSLAAPRNKMGPYGLVTPEPKVYL